jgi:hypothetical protein
MNTAKYKYCYYVLFLILIISCEKFNYTADENKRQYIDSYSDMEQAVTGAYAKFASIFANEYWRNSYMIQGVLADDYDLFNGSSCSGDSCNSLKFKTLDDNGDTVYLMSGAYRYYSLGDEIMIGESYLDFMDAAYSDFYKAITSQNYIICQFENRAISNDSMNELLGEVYYLRAYSYYRLTRFFGRIPLITDIDVDYQVHPASFEEIYSQIESDLLQAIILLQVTANSTRIPYITPSRGSAKALLAEVYLTMGGYPLHDEAKYILSAKYAREVIDSASIFGFGLIDDFAGLQNWKLGLNKEMVSVVNYKSDFNWDVLNNTYYRPDFNTNELSLFPRDAIAEVKFINNYPASYRKNCTYNRAHKINVGWDTSTRDYIYKTVYPIKTTTSYSIPLKNSLIFDLGNYMQNEEYYIYILRYAHTLLTYAEASARAGNIDAMSYEAVNQVRRRANKLPINTTSKFDLLEGLPANEFIDSVVWERAWEFTGEAEGRWFDLLRLDMVGKLNELRDPHEAPPLYDGILKGKYFFPIPEDDIFLNPNLANN